MKVCIYLPRLLSGPSSSFLPLSFPFKLKNFIENWQGRSLEINLLTLLALIHLVSPLLLKTCFHTFRILTGELAFTFVVVSFLFSAHTTDFTLFMGKVSNQESAVIVLKVQLPVSYTYKPFPVSSSSLIFLVWCSHSVKTASDLCSHKQPICAVSPLVLSLQISW